MSKNTNQNRRIKSTAVKYLLALVLLIVTSSCGGGSGTTITNPNYGAVDGNVYAPVGSSARVAEAAPAGYMAVSGADVSVTCGSSTKNTTPNSTGYFKIASLPVGNCTLTVTKNGYSSYQANIGITANSTTTAGGSEGILMTPSTSGSINVTTNVSGGEVIIDGKETNIVIPSSLNNAFNNISPGSHTVTINQSGYDAISAQTLTVVQGQTSEITFNLNPTGNRAPTANAGTDMNSFVGTKYKVENGEYVPMPIAINLDGAGSNDPDGNALLYSWVQESGPLVNIENHDSATASFVPLQEGYYEFSLKVSDGYLSSASNTIRVYAAKPTGVIIYQAIWANGSEEITRINTDGSGLEIITDNYNTDIYPSWSTDGGKIVYVCYIGVTPEICVINSDGSGYVQLTNNTDYNYSPDWSPGNDKIIWARGTLYNHEVYSMNTDGSSQTKLTNVAQDIFDPEYSFDGTNILFLSDYGSDNYEVMVMDNDGGNLTRLTNNTTTELDATWMPDGRILYTSQNSLVDYTRHLYVMNADGTGRQEISIPSNVENINNPTVSSDGQSIFFNDDDGYLWVMYADGGAAMSYGLGGSKPDYHPGP